MRYIPVYFLILILPIQNSAAQSLRIVDPFPGYRQAVFLAPQYVAISGIRVDYERKLRKGHQWIVIAPQYYSDQNGYEDFDSFTGYGINMYFKRFLSHSVRVNDNGLPRTNVYFATGPAFQNFAMRSTEEVPEEFIDNGVTYIRYSQNEVKTRIYKTGLNADFGVQIITDRFSIDFYGGVGLRLAFDENGEIMDYFNEYWIDFGYTGFLLNGGIRLGFMVR